MLLRCSWFLSWGRWQQDYASKLNIVLVSRGEEKTNRAKTAKWGVRCVLLQTDHEVSRAYRVRRIPAAIIVRPYSRTASPTVVGVQGIRALVEQFVNNVTVITR